MAALTPELLEALLWEGESTTLDYKSEQYRFKGASEAEKGELLKDVLAFVNARLRSDAYILIGVKEVKGGRAEVLGVGDHLEDSDLQQFANSKTNRRVEFGYSAVEVEGRQVGVLTVAQNQSRPIWLKSDYGKLKANYVYQRMGTSTAVLTPDDLLSQGRAEAAELREVPQGIVEIASGPSFKYGEPLALTSVVYEQDPADWYPDQNPPLDTMIGPHLTRAALARVLARPTVYEVFSFKRRLGTIHTLTVRVRNPGTVLLVNPIVRITVPSGIAVEVLDYDTFPNDPNVREERPARAGGPTVTVDQTTLAWITEVHFPKVHAGRTEVSQPFWLECENAGTFKMAVSMTAENLGRPVASEVEVTVLTETEVLPADQCQSDY